MKKDSKEDISGKTNIMDKLSKFPSWIIILLLKYWAAAAAIFFSVIGGVDIGLNLDSVKESTAGEIFAQDFSLVILIGLFLGLFTYYLVRPTVRMMYNRKNRAYRYNMIN
ncbi:MAG: hypothetical protein K2N65_03905, partial [Anaeroplasmataceae bacterium]|nr:hypothetical protein [Anaeroplasmataceae bacterium]